MTRTLRPGYDRHELRPAFGVVFRDRFDQRVVADGLRVELRGPQRREPLQRLAPNGHGVFAAHAVRGLRVPPGPESPALTRSYTLTVTDMLGRFVPLRVAADLPGDGLFAPECTKVSPPAGDPHVPLFSAAARPVPAGVAVVRADLRLASAAGAPWARVELRLDGTVLAEGVADERGSVLLLAPWPALRDAPLHSSPPLPPEPRWSVTLHAHWHADLARAQTPDLCDLRRLPEVPLLARAAPPTPLPPLVLQAGVPLIARSDGLPFVLVGA